MDEVIGELLTLAVVAALSPVPIIAVILILLSERARHNGIAFAIGWVAGIAGAMGILIAIASTQDLATGAEPSGTVSWIKVILGVLLLLAAAKGWRSRPAPGSDPKMPGWTRKIDQMNPRGALGFAVLLSLNPKSLLLIAGAAVGVAQAQLGSTDQVLAVAVFTLIASSTVVIPTLVYLVAGRKAQPILDRARDRLSAHSTVVMTVLLSVIGIVLLVRGVAGLA